MPSSKIRTSFTILSVSVILATAILEYVSPAGAFFSIGYLIAILLAAKSGSRYSTLLVTIISIFSVWLPFTYQTNLSFEVLLISRLYASIGMLIASSLILKYLSDQKKAAGNQALMEGIFSYGTQAILLLKEDSRIVLVNRFTESIFQYKEGTIAGKLMEELAPELDVADLASHPTGATALRFDTVGKRSDETTFPIEVSVNTFALNEQRYTVAFIIDISHRASQEEKLNAQKRSLEEVNAELEAFSYSVSHDLRAPLRAVSGYAKMLEEDAGPSLDNEGRRLLQVIQDSARKMGLLIDELLQFSRLGRKGIKKTRVDMMAVVDNVLFELEKNSIHQPAITILPLHPANADSSLIGHVWTNLLSNAIKYTSKSANPTIMISSQYENGKVVYSVVDNGAGFDMQYAHKLFGVFQRLHSPEEFEGTGVGLATAQRIIEKHGGEIWAEGEVGAGAKFNFHLGS